MKTILTCKVEVGNDDTAGTVVGDGLVGVVKLLGRVRTPF